MNFQVENENLKIILKSAFWNHDQIIKSILESLFMGECNCSDRSYCKLHVFSSSDNSSN